jgi:hypothetical protein
VTKEVEAFKEQQDTRKLDQIFTAQQIQERVLLAWDADIKDPTILEQIFSRGSTQLGELDSP